MDRQWSSKVKGLSRVRANMLPGFGLPAEEPDMDDVAWALRPSRPETDGMPGVRMGGPSLRHQVSNEKCGNVMSLLGRQFGDHVLCVRASDHGRPWSCRPWNLSDAGRRVPVVIG